ncbi:MAG TPA: ribosome biogenesis GTP-binding protein YihA/YsxC [Saprospiraceae bacterium]|nr:YihA family ribosome biogenesis GTP-binding protein [Lewinellaceae bacterium]HRX29521.1 ribosome biogenesis GTP-binding protein YihA/YsxC [Saprospiraceae bacterium]
MEIKEVEYIGSYEHLSQCPKPNMPEVAFIGRSNVGKSSLINMLCNKKDMARTSKQPGKTQTINYYYVQSGWYLVDLPGYGYAKVSKHRRNSWEKMIERYLELRENLQCAFVLVDSRHELQKIDLEFINWLGERAIPFSIIYTKIDKVKNSKQDANIQALNDALMEYWNSLPPSFVTSAETGEGKDELLKYIDSLTNLSE